jgi:23S rRNA pseudouridine2605 synthase
VNGEVIRQLGTRVDPTQARVAVDGEPIRPEATVYYAINKPKGYVSTNVDPAGRPRVLDLIPEIPQRVYTVGRLDEDSTGLMILTNDGELANRLAHPRYGVEKTYRALVAGVPERETISKLTEGVWLSDGKVRAKRARIVGRQGQATLLELVLAEGKKREVRRMLSKLGHKVMALNRIAVGPVTLAGLSAGECRPLSRREIDLLRRVASGAPLSQPEFSGSGSSSHARTHRDSHERSPAPRVFRPAREEGARRQTSDRHQVDQAARPGAKRKRPPSPRRPVSASEEAATSGTQGGGNIKKGRPPRRRPAADPQLDLRPANAPTRQPSPAVPGRRIIGLGTAKLTSAHTRTKGRRTPKRPPRLRRRALGSGSTPKPDQPKEEGATEPGND